MKLSRIELIRDHAQSPAFWERLGSLADVHRLVWTWFGDSADRKRDFLYRHEGVGTSGRFYTLSDRAPVDDSGLWRIETKTFTPRLNEGDTLEFSLRANPTIRKASGEGKGKRHDVVMDAKLADRAAGTPRSEIELVEATCSEWLLRRADRCGFEVRRQDLRVGGYRSVRFPRSRGQSEASVSMVDFDGQLIVRDPQRFVESVWQGIGPAKGFGCGLMLIRRV